MRTVERVYKQDRDQRIRKVVCPECRDQGARSRVYWNGGENQGTAVAVDRFWDEQGRFHHHDPRISHDRYRCTEGHEFQISSRNKCWCGWLHDGDPPTEADTVARLDDQGKLVRQVADGGLVDAASKTEWDQ